MVQILMSAGQRELRRAVLDELCRDGAENQLLIVPEQASHEMERALCAAGGPSVCLRAEVLSFSRLATRVFSLYGGLSRKTLDQGGRLIAMAQALEAVSSRLKLYAAGRRRSEFLLRMLRMIEEFRAARIAPAQLHGAAARTSGQLAEKLEELSLILESYETVCAAMGQDPGHRLARLAGLLGEHDYAAGRRIFLLGFTDFTGQELAVLDALLDRADSVTAGILGDGSDRGPFSLTAGTVLALKRLAERHGRSFAISLLPDDPACAPALLHLRRHVLSGGPAPFAGGGEHVLLHRSDGVHAACMDAAGLIQRLVLDRGWRYRDIAVCCTAPEAYGPSLESVFGRLDIPLYRAGAEPIRNDPVVGMLLSALEAATGGMDSEDVLRFLKTGLSPLSQAEADELENYVRAWRIRGGRWASPWDMPPGGFGAGTDEEALRRLNGMRAHVARLLLPLRDGLRSAGNTAAQVEALYRFLDGIDLAGTLETMARRCETAAQLQRAQEYGQMYETILDALEQLYRVLGPTVRTPEDFADMVAAVLSRYSVGTIPANLDSVVAGGPEAMRFSDCRAMLILGAEDGTLPALQSETGLLTERERHTLLDLGLPVAPGRSDRLDRALIEVHQVAASPADIIYVNYCSEQPAYLFTRLQTLFPELRVGEDEAVPTALTYAAEPLAEFLAERADLPSVLQERARALRGRASHRPGRLNPAEVRGLYGEKLYLSASRIDQYAACRCAYFLRYGLRLRPQKEAVFDAPAYGTFVHAVLEGTARRVRDEGGFHAVTPERLEAIATEEMDAYRDEALTALLADSERFAYLFGRCRLEVLEVVRELGRELRASDFEPARFELEFSAAGPLPPVEIRGQRARAEVSGFVDRVDLYTCGGTTYVRVVDYKTGRKSFDYADIMAGMGLQMLIYLFALEQNGEAEFQKKLRPAGVLYVPARRPILPAVEKPGADEAARRRRAEQVRKGLLLAEAPALAAMEHFEDAPVYMPLKIGRTGELTGDLADAREFSLLRGHVRRTLERMADELAGGAVEPNPVVRGADWSPCDWCDYAEVCHRASGELETRPMRKVDRNEFWSRLKEAEDHG